MKKHKVIEMENNISIFIGAVTDEKVKTASISEALLKIGGVSQVWELTGSLDLLVLVRSPSIQAINDVVEAVRASPGVLQATSYLVLDTHGAGGV
ncbi:MAG: Lrp/AsnC ligand binding domain-containing protein [Candidatus Marsarchaeota archaeon]|nr:Lrp/AsnC ligand binding domain-containing protein [Candidatus Marsarchaeota archaeon]